MRKEGEIRGFSPNTHSLLGDGHNQERKGIVLLHCHARASACIGHGIYTDKWANKMLSLKHEHFVGDSLVPKCYPPPAVHFGRINEFLFCVEYEKVIKGYL